MERVCGGGGGDKQMGGGKGRGWKKCIVLNSNTCTLMLSSILCSNMALKTGERAVVGGEGRGGRRGERRREERGEEEGGEGRGRRRRERREEREEEGRGEEEEGE